MKLQQHPIAKEFTPQPTGDELDRVKESIAKFGYEKRCPVYLYEGKILVGWTRYQAAIALNVEPEFATYDGNEPVAFVLINEFARRHISVVARLARAEKMRPALEAEAKKREKQGKKSTSDPAANLPQGRVDKIIGEAEGVSERTVRNFHKVQEHGTETLKAAVADETLSISDAATVATKPAPVQETVVKAVKSGKARTAKAALNGVHHPIGDASEAEPEEITDAEGARVPEKAIPAFKNAKLIEALGRDIDAIIHRAEALAKAPGGRLIRIQAVRQQLKDAKENLWVNRATHVCPYCHGKKDACQSCKGEGWTAKHIWNQAPGCGLSTKHAKK